MVKESKKTKNSVNISNRKASYEYHLLDEFDCGIKLIGSEVKSIRENGASISDAYCYVNNGEVFVKGMHISELKNAEPHEPLRERKLLLTKKEIRKIVVELKNTGLTLIPTVLFNKKGLMKLKIRLAKGKKLFDKRESIKARDIKRNDGL